ncbi:MAG TPA: histidine kinase dimerization/phospho-acceptor domain-containing protein, partial [Hymenobacter sp.]
MRYLLLLAALWLLSGVATAAPLPADTTVLHINRLPEGGLMLTQGWRYHPGDDAAWARPDFDDSAWDTLNPSRPRRELPRAGQTGISWLRLRFRLGDSLRQHDLLLRTASRTGAYEVYLNGRLVQRSGRLAADPANVRPSGILSLPPVEVAGAADVVLAVRFAPWRPLLAQALAQSGYFYLSLTTAATARQNQAEGANVELLFFGSACVAGLLLLLHLAFFVFNPAQRANLYFAGYAGTMALSALSTFGQAHLPFASLGQYLLYDFVGGYALLCLSGLWAVRALTLLFGFRTGRGYIALWVLCGVLLSVTGVYFAQPAGPVACVVAIGLLTLEQLRLTARALRLRRRGAWIIGAGFATALLALLLFAAMLLDVVPASYFVLNLFAFPLSFLPPALGISLFLAREFALDSQLLQVKLGEVERLSAQTLAQEQDKQALLAAQNETLEQQVTQRTCELQRSLTDLRTTQAQLIQREKMASLGELTAGIAHEIQNPLNFVNNFSEVSAELMAELEEAQAAGDAEEVAALAVDVRQNLGKITEHGRRAAAIVRGMLEHSRTSSGERVTTDLNRLCDEYLRLAYQGLRANDKSFNAALRTDFAPELAPVNMVGADVGRVLLNLFSNAFYAVRQRQQAGEPGYQPTVGVTTERVNGHVQIRVS